VAATARGIVGLALFSLPDLFAADLGRSARLTFVPRLPAAERHLERARSELDAYFAGGSGGFTVPVDLRVRSAWDHDVLTVVRCIGYGDAIGYGDVARRMGRVGAARAVGGSVGRNPIGILVPCHRVIAGDGSLGGYGRDWYGSREERLSIKRHLLGLEGVAIG
jgi:methylated-DNA-[protein]-cysteine S-methyltransferase